MSPVVTGDENFRPVGIALAPDGSLFISDWVLKSYEVHGKGRIWHLSAERKTDSNRAPKRRPKRSMPRIAHCAKTPRGSWPPTSKLAGPLLEKLAVEDASPRTRALAIAALSNVQSFAAAERAAVADPASEVRAAGRSRSAAGVDRAGTTDAGGRPPKFGPRPCDGRAIPRRRTCCGRAVADNDAFVAQAAREGLARLHAASAEAASTRSSPVERLACLLILRETRDPQGRSALPKLLRDTDANVRFAAVQWVGEERLTAFRGGLADALAAGPASSRLFGGYLAALERLDGVVRTADDEWAGEQYIVRALEDPTTSPEVRRWSLRMLRPDHPLLSVERLRQFVASGDAALQREAVRTLRDCHHSDRTALLVANRGRRAISVVAAGRGDRGSVRRRTATRVAAGLAGGARRTGASRRGLAIVARRRVERCRSGNAGRMIARDRPPSGRARRARAQSRHRAQAAGARMTCRAGCELIGSDRTGKSAGDAGAGERIFFHARSAGCSRCHQIAGRGARVGPELTATAGTLSRERLIESIVRPSKEIAPHFSSWTIVTTAGKALVGMLVKEEATGEQTYADQKGELFRFKPGEIESRQAQAVSIMPDGLPQLLTVQEFRDLLAFMQSPQSPQP